MKKAVIFILCQLCVLFVISQPLTPLIDSIPMRDGKKLAADIYLPSGSLQRPTILIQTPYNRIYYRYGLPIGIGLAINSCNYNIVIVDWRGFYGSVNAWVASPNRGYDGYDAVDWIKDQSWSDGQIGTWGPSALGKVQYQTAKEKHPNHICAVPLVAGTQFEYNEYYQGGVYRTEYLEQLDALGYGMSATILANPFYNTVWQYVENTNWYPGEIEIPMLLIGGWYDHNTDLMLNLFSGMTAQSPAASQQKILMGPWAHGGFGMAQVGTAQQGELFFYEAEEASDTMAMSFLNYHMLGTNNYWPDVEKYTCFQMGENVWYETPVWPPVGMTDFTLFLTSAGLLELNQPQNPTGFSIITYDPSDPSPSYGGETLRQDLHQGPYDQADSVEARNDILIFDTPVLSQNVIMKGKPLVKLFVSSDRKDTDFAVRLTDVYPDGRSMLLSEGIKRMRFRNGYTTGDTASMIPSQIYEVEIELKNTSVTFLAGHKIRIDITSSNYPRFDNNLNNGGTMYTSGDTLVATNSVFHNLTSSSYVVFQFDDYNMAVNHSDKPDELITVYPNPAKNDLFVDLTGIKNDYAIISLSDINGRVIQNQIVRNICYEKPVKFNISEINKGIYILNVKTTENSFNQKICIY
jgi:predicted acyl esterase